MPPTAQPTLRVTAPQPNGVLTSGTNLTVSGVATGIAGSEPSPGHPGHEPAFITSVTVTLAGVSTDATLTPIRPQIPHQPPAANFTAKLVVPAVGGNQQLQVVARADNGSAARANIPLTIHLAHNPPAAWTTSQRAPTAAVPQTARLTAIAKPVGCEMWWIGKNGAVNGIWTEPGSPWANYQLTAAGVAAPGGGITAVSKGGDLMEVWWIGPHGSIQAAYHDANWNLYTLAAAGSASLTGSTTAVFKGGDVMEVWWIAPDGSVQAAYHEGDWKYYTLAGPGSAALTGSITAVFKGGDVMEVWWIAPDGSVRAAYHEGDWKYYTLAGPNAAAVTGGITSVFKGGDLMEVWWVAPDGSVTGAYHDSQWQTYTLAGPHSASPHCRITSAYGSSFVPTLAQVWWVDNAGTTFQGLFNGQWSIVPIGAGASPSGTIVGVLFNPDTPTAIWARPDGSLVDAFPQEITLSTGVSGGRGLRGTVWLTLRQDGSTRWRGNVTNGEVYGYDYALSVYASTGSSADIGAAHKGSVAGSLEPGSSNDVWDELHDPNPALAGDLAAYRFSALTLKLEHSVDVVNYLESAIDGIFEVAAGITIGWVGSVLLIGVEIGTWIATGSPFPGIFISSGIPWLVGPGGLFLRLFDGGAGRQLTPAEYAWANDMVFRGALPPIDSFRITSYIGGEGRPFTFPTFAGPTLVNVGDAIFANPHSDEKTVIHELTHVCQIANSHNVLFTAQGMLTQFQNEIDGGHVYDYGPAGFDYTKLGLEAQAEVVEDWFVGHAVEPMSNDHRNHTNKPMDALSPYYRYITDNVRVGHF